MGPPFCLPPDTGPLHPHPGSCSPSLQVVLTLSRGRLVWDGTNLNVTAGSGRFIPMPLFQSSRPDDLGAVVPGTAPTCPSGHRVKHADTQRVATLTYA